MTYDLNYLEIPAVLKYKYEVDDHFSIQPQVGGYFAVGVGGKIKNFAEREAQSSFRSDNFRRLAEHAQKLGVWGIGSMAPPFPKIGRIEELVKYCEEIASAAPELPFYYYHIPAFNGAFLPMLDLLKAVDGRIPNFAGIKYTFESLYEYNQCRLYKDGKFDMLHGQDETILPSLAMGGAQGGIGGTTNSKGKELVGIIEAWKNGDIETAREKQNFAQEVINVICHYRGNIVGGKRIMKLMGFDLGPNRTPFRNMTIRFALANYASFIRSPNALASGTLHAAHR